MNGYARNLPDGGVELLAQGDAACIETFAEWLHHGPPLARVDGVRREPAAIEESTDFRFG